MIRASVMATVFCCAAGTGCGPSKAPPVPPSSAGAAVEPGAPAGEPPTASVQAAPPAPATATKPPPPTEDRVPVGPAKLLPLRAAEASIFAASPQDAATELRLGVTRARHGKHYLAGNEKTLQAFLPHIKDLGGGYVGVGSDQAYLLLGWVRPEVAWFIDYDQDVVDIHAVYRVFFEHAETPEAMLALWSKEHKARAADLILEAFPGERGDHLRALYLNNRGWIQRRLRGVGKRLRKAEVPSYLNDQVHYDFVRSMLAAGRVRPLLANLLETTGVQGVAAAAKKMGVEIKVLYLSNAEEYWKQYSTNFRDNVASLPFAADAKILRTLLIWDVNEDYRYNIQPARNFLEWLAQPYTTNVYDIVHARGRPDPKAINVFETDEPPQASPAARRAETR